MALSRAHAICNFYMLEPWCLVSSPVSSHEILALLRPAVRILFYAPSYLKIKKTILLVSSDSTQWVKKRNRCVRAFLTSVIIRCLSVIVCKNDHVNAKRWRILLGANSVVPEFEIIEEK